MVNGGDVVFIGNDVIFIPGGASEVIGCSSCELLHWQLVIGTVVQLLGVVELYQFL